jgi:hypothetical protein
MNINVRQKYALIEFLFAFYADIISVRSFTPIFYEDHKLWLDERICQPFVQHGLDGISFEDIQVLAKVYEDERNDYLA